MMMASMANKKTFLEVSHLPSYNENLQYIAAFLLDQCTRGDSSGRARARRTVFDGDKPAAVSIQDYIIRMCKYGFTSKEVFVFIVIYLDRFRKHCNVELTSYNCHRLLLISFVVAAKLRDDTYYANKYYASIGGVTLKEFNNLESEFLKGIEWDLHVTRAAYNETLRFLTNWAQQGTVLREPVKITAESTLNTSYQSSRTRHHEGTTTTRYPVTPNRKEELTKHRGAFQQQSPSILQTSPHQQTHTAMDTSVRVLQGLSRKEIATRGTMPYQTFRPVEPAMKAPKGIPPYTGVEVQPDTDDLGTTFRSTYC